MKFRTEYIPEKAPFILDPSSPVVMAGSCFSQNIAAKMEECLWKSVNPFGTLYNPLSIAKAIDIMLDESRGLQRFENSLFNFNGIWSSHLFDSSFSSVRKEDCVEEFLGRRKGFLEALQNGKTLIVTFGTSIVYYLSETGEAVGNCHKQPSGIFYVRRLSVGEIVSEWNRILKDLRDRFAEIKVIFTVSPVRHLKDGFSGNSKSKAVLLLAVEDIVAENTKCCYFPAYEILNDDLRDYRFYAEDLAHPSDLAIEYIWEKFQATFIDESGMKILKEGEKSYKALHHRPKTGALGKPLV